MTECRTPTGSQAIPQLCMFGQGMSNSRIEKGAKGWKNDMPYSWTWERFVCVDVGNGELAFHSTEHNRFLRLNNGVMDRSAECVQMTPLSFKASHRCQSFGPQGYGQQMEVSSKDSDKRIPPMSRSVLLKVLVSCRHDCRSEGSKRLLDRKEQRVQQRLHSRQLDLGAVQVEGLGQGWA